MTAIPDLVLASASPRRAAILTTLGISHRVDVADIDEAGLPDEGPAERVARLAIAKAAAVRGRNPASWILGGDTEVVLDGASLGKPSSPESAAEMLRQLSGRTHVVLSSIALDRPDHPPLVEVEVTRVRVRELTATEIDGYIRSGEPMDKAGGYGIQGLGSALVSGIEGDYSGVVGLPVPALLRLLDRAGVPFAF